MTGRRQRNRNLIIMKSGFLHSLPTVKCIIHHESLKLSWHRCRYLPRFSSDSERLSNHEKRVEKDIEKRKVCVWLRMFVKHVVCWCHFVTMECCASCFRKLHAVMIHRLYVCRSSHSGSFFISDFFTISSFDAMCVVWRRIKDSCPSLKFLLQALFFKEIHELLIKQIRITLSKNVSRDTLSILLFPENLCYLHNRDWRQEKLPGYSCRDWGNTWSWFGNQKKQPASFVLLCGQKGAAFLCLGKHLFFATQAQSCFCLCCKKFIWKLPLYFHSWRVL